MTLRSPSAALSMKLQERTILQCLEDVGVLGRFQIFLGIIYILGSACSGYVTFQFQSLSVAPPVVCLSDECTVLKASGSSDNDIICSLETTQHWIFQKGHSNMYTEFNLYCDRTYIISMGTTIYFLGFFLAVSPLSTLTDRLGRKRSAEMFILLHVLTLALMMISTSLAQIMTCRFILGAVHGGASVALCVAFYEFTSADMATFFMMLSSAGFSLGGGLSGLVAMGSSHWQQTCVIPLLGFTILGALFHFIVPETPHWLFAKGMERAAINSLNKVAGYNGVQHLKNIELVSVTGEVTSSKKSQSFAILWQTPFLRNAIACLAFGWFTVSICYYGLEFNAGSMGNEYVIMILMGCFDTPFKISMYVFAGRCGRQFACQVYLGSALACLICTAFPIAEQITIYGNFTLKIILVSCGRAFGGSVFALFYIYTTEILPTLVRSLGISCCSTVARIGSLLAPLVILVNQISPYIIYVFIVICLVITMYLLRSIPETLGKPLPNNLEDCKALFNCKDKGRRDDGHHAKVSIM